MSTNNLENYLQFTYILLVIVINMKCSVNKYFYLSCVKLFNISHIYYFSQNYNL